MFIEYIINLYSIKIFMNYILLLPSLRRCYSDIFKRRNCFLKSAIVFPLREGFPYETAPTFL